MPREFRQGLAGDTDVRRNRTLRTDEGGIVSQDVSKAPAMPGLFRLGLSPSRSLLDPVLDLLKRDIELPAGGHRGLALDDFQHRR